LEVRRKGNGEINGQLYNVKWKIKELKFNRRNPIKYKRISINTIYGHENI